jgi:respiratory-chain NADH dehydrogenase domain 51 kDa subunit
MRLVIPLKQHVGGPCEALVSAKDKVKRGQLIAKPNGLGANIHASANAEVVEVNDKSIVLETIGDIDLNDYVRLEGEDYLELIKAAGIVGAGGAGFPTHVKYGTKVEGGYLIANAAECEPLLSHNMEMLMREPEKILRGMKYVMEITGTTHGIVAIKPKHQKEMITIAKACKNFPGIQVKFLPDMYPAGDERVVIREFLNIELEPGVLPIEARAVVSNIETLRNVARAIEDKMPVMTKDITVAGRVQKPQVFLDQPIGADIKSYIDECGGYIEPHGEIVLGGPFTGRHGEESEPIVKTLGGIIVAMPFIEDHRKIGFIECECGAQYDRLAQIAQEMGAEVVGSVKCKRMKEVNGRFRCELPGICPGQAEKVLELKKMGAEVVMVGTCED